MKKRRCNDIACLSRNRREIGQVGIFDQLQKSKGGYIFLSHSHEDIEKVREIRNSLEQDGFEPLCFYLKCLSDDSEIEDLIKREIDAREWFVFVNSENSRKSKWVTLEREYILRTNRKKVITIDIDDENSIREAIYKISHNLRIFLSYSNKDTPLADRIYRKLAEKDYQTFFAPASLSAGIDFASSISNAVVEASQEGGVWALITPEYMKSEWAIKELSLALKLMGNIIPIIVGDVQLDLRMQLILNHYLWYRISEDPTDIELDELIDRIGSNIMRQH